MKDVDGCFKGVAGCLKCVWKNKIEVFFANDAFPNFEKKNWNFEKIDDLKIDTAGFGFGKIFLIKIFGACDENFE